MFAAMRFFRLRLIRFLAVLAVVLAGAAAFAQKDEEVPFITTPDNVTQEMLRMANVGPGDHVIDLGSGDGRIVILAAKRFGATGLGVEIDPELVRQSIRNARDAGVAARVTFREQDLFQTDLSVATVITMYLLPQVNLQLRPAVLALKAGTRVVSHDWDMGDWKPDRTSVVPVPDKKVGLEKSSKVHLWVVPAQVEGLWCGTGPLSEFSLRLSQRYQEVQGSLARRDRVRSIEGRVEGATLRTQATRHGSLVLEMAGDDELQVTDGEGALALARGAAFQRANGSACSG
jgi:SAM-dependent methyltransferase